MIRGGVAGQGARGGQGGNDLVSSVRSLQEYALTLAVEALQLDADDLFFWFDPTFAIGELGKTFINGNSGTRSGQLQALRLNTGAAAGSYSAVMAGKSDATGPRMVAAGATKKFWIAGYFKLNAATVAGDDVGIGLHGDANALRLIVGAQGSTSLTNFIADGDTGAGIDSGLAIDTSNHLHQFWRDGSTGNYKIDQRATVQGDTRPSTNANPWAIASTTAGGTDLQLDLGWFAVAVQKE